MIFGISCRDKQINSPMGIKRTTILGRRSLILSRRSLTSDRFTSTAIKDILKETLEGNEKQDIEDVARLLCLYLYLSLFFSTMGTKIGWIYLEYMEDLDSMKDYN